jgi:hypothetical protein
METSTVSTGSRAEEIRSRLRRTLKGIGAGDLDWLAERPGVLGEVFGEIVREHRNRQALEAERDDLAHQLEVARADAFNSETRLNSLLAERSKDDPWDLGRRQSEARKAAAEKARHVVQLEAAIRSVEQSMASAN